MLNLQETRQMIGMELYVYPEQREPKSCCVYTQSKMAATGIMRSCNFTTNYIVFTFVAPIVRCNLKLYVMLLWNKLTIWALMSL